jgi:hypothetical protein
MLDIAETYNYVACSDKVGTLNVTNPETGNSYIITKFGHWVFTEDALYFIEQKYQVWCPLKRRHEMKQAIFPATPTIDQMKLKPQEV